jgi:hypothetical protein
MTPFSNVEFRQSIAALQARNNAGLHITEVST